MSAAQPGSPQRGAAWADDWRGALNATAAMLPLVLSYGLIAFAALGPAAVAPGLAASLTSVVLGGLLLAAWSGTRLPAASPSVSSCLILGAAALQWLRDPALAGTADALPWLFALAGLTVVLAGVLQVLMGVLRAGGLGRYVPRPVLAGFMNGIAVLLVISQLPAALGLPAQALQREGLAALRGVQWPALATALATAALVWVVSRAAPRAPAALVAFIVATGAASACIAAGGEHGFALERLGALQLHWPGVQGPLLWVSAETWPLLSRHAPSVATTALLLALIGALESVLNLAATDHRMAVRSDPNRMLIGLGLCNIVLGLVGALPVVYLRLRALATLLGGARQARAIVLGSLLMAAVVVLGRPLVELVPKAVLAGIVITIARALLDPWSLALLRQGSAGLGERGLNLGVIGAVCAVTVVWGYAAGVSLGLLLSFAILVRALDRSLVRRRYCAADFPSRRAWPLAQEQVLAQARQGIEILELEGTLFFGNVDRLQREAEALTARGKLDPVSSVTAWVLDLRHVSSIDASGALALVHLRDELVRHGVHLLMAGVAPANRLGLALAAQGALAGDAAGWSLHADADQAVEAAEALALRRCDAASTLNELPLNQCALFEGVDATQLAVVTALLRRRVLQSGERLFREGDAGDALYVLSAGSISVLVAREGPRGRDVQRFLTLSPGMTLGETALLDGAGRSADAVADTACIVHALDAAALAQLQRMAPDVAARLYLNLARHLSQRLRAASTAWRRAME